jgi:hypothetical protein
MYTVNATAYDIRHFSSSTFSITIYRATCL